jgi:hypothetical protein
VREEMREGAERDEERIAVLRKEMSEYEETQRTKRLNKK